MDKSPVWKELLGSFYIDVDRIIDEAILMKFARDADKTGVLERFTKLLVQNGCKPSNVLRAFTEFAKTENKED